MAIAHDDSHRDARPARLREPPPGRPALIADRNNNGIVKVDSATPATVVWTYSTADRNPSHCGGVMPVKPPTSLASYGHEVAHSKSMAAQPSAAKPQAVAEKSGEVMFT
jgi:hypothetical protein